VRFTPTLTFVADAVPENARHIEHLLQQAAAADAMVHQIAADDEPAGDPDPYKPAGESDGGRPGDEPSGAPFGR
jgi:ribosome-binding factor A